MDEETKTPPAAEPPEEKKPEHLIEHAPSGRSRCKGCRRTIDKGALRVGFVFEGPYGVGFLWHHLTCAARRRPEDLEAAYAASAWENAKVPPTGIPELATLKANVEKAEKKRAVKKEIPYAELDPSGRAKCKHCEKPLAKGDPRVVLGRAVEFGSQTRVGPINVHVGCVVEALDADDCDTDASGFAAELRANSASLEPAQVEEILKAIGNLPGDDSANA